MDKMKIGILMLTYNAPRYVYEAITSLSKTKSKVPYELVVVDNQSHIMTRQVLKLLKHMGMIDVLFLNERNDLFAKGNNIASELVSKDTTHYLLLNSDIKIKDSEWLDKLVKIYPKEGGISALGVVESAPVRADGYCLLIDRAIYDKYKLNEDYEWWWSVTYLESQVLSEGLKIRAVKNHEKLLHHYGGKSGKGYKDAKGMDIGIDSVIDWFKNRKESVEIIDVIE